MNDPFYLKSAEEEASTAAIQAASSGCVSSWALQEYLIKVGGLSRGAVDMIGDLLNEDSGFYLSFLASLWDFNIFSEER